MGSHNEFAELAQSVAIGGNIIKDVAAGSTLDLGSRCGGYLECNSTGNKTIVVPPMKEGFWFIVSSSGGTLTLQTTSPVNVVTVATGVTKLIVFKKSSGNVDIAALTFTASS